MTQSGWNALLGEAIMSLTPIYIILQIWLGSAWKGSWRWIALAPLLGFVPAFIIAFIGLAEASNLWAIAIIVFAPAGCMYFLVAGVAREAIVKRSMTYKAIAGSHR